MGLSFLVASLAATSTTTPFMFVPYGTSAASLVQGPTISCDGKVEGSTLELTHWTDHQTPRHLYADTSTEIALKFLLDEDQNGLLETATIINNHYDTDGVLSVWALQNPEEALENKALLISGAEAGDFGEWTSDEGLKLDSILSALYQGSEEDAYVDALSKTLEILKDLRNTGGDSYRHLWERDMRAAEDGWRSIQSGNARVTTAGPVAIVEQDENSPALSCYALHRGLQGAVNMDDITRVLHIFSSSKRDTFRYKYELPGHGWVQELVSRKAVPKVTDASSLVDALGSDWKVDAGGLISICSTKSSVLSLEPPDVVVETLLELDQESLPC